MKYMTHKETLNTRIRYRSCVLQIALLFVILSTCLSSSLPSQNGSNFQEVHKSTLSKIGNELQQNAPDNNYGQESDPDSQRNYRDFTAQCDEEKITISGSFKSNFRGRLYALDYVDDPDCGSVAGNGASENVTFTFPLGQCGVQMTVLNNNLENNLRHTVALYIQYSAFLQQIIDDKVVVSCIETKKKLHLENITSNSAGTIQTRRSRQGRKFKGSPVKSGLTDSKIGEAWMEILIGKDPSPKSKNGQPVQVGEEVTLVVTTKVTRGYDARVVNCTAHDGSRTTSDGSRIQPILDSAGCSIDRGLVPNFRRRRLPIESRNQLTLHFSTFPAFKFPERDHIHVRCSVAYCLGPCPQESCDSGVNHYGSWKDKYGRVADILVETSDIVNAVEVLSPEMEGYGGVHHYERHQSSNSGLGSASVAESAPTSFTSDSARHQRQHQFSDTQSLPPVPQHQQQQQGNGNLGSTYNSDGPQSLNSNYHYSPHAINGQAIYANNQIPQGIPNGPTVCISPGTVILALVILGIVLVISATATLWLALKRSEAKKYAQQKISPFSTTPAPSPYYRFNHW